MWQLTIFLTLVPEDLTPFLVSLRIPGRHRAHRYTSRQNTHAHKIKRNLLKAKSTLVLPISVLARMILHRQSLSTRAGLHPEFQECYHRLIALILPQPRRACLPRAPITTSLLSTPKAPTFSFSSLCPLWPQKGGPLDSFPQSLLVSWSTFFHTCVSLWLLSPSLYKRSSSGSCEVRWWQAGKKHSSKHHCACESGRVFLVLFFLNPWWEILLDFFSSYFSSRNKIVIYIHLLRSVYLSHVITEKGLKCKHADIYFCKDRSCFEFQWFFWAQPTTSKQTIPPKKHLT